MPWAVRPRRHDDWGWIRDANGDAACMARWSPELTEENLDAHRANKTDPAQANADLIVKAVNSYHEMHRALSYIADASSQSALRDMARAALAGKALT